MLKRSACLYAPNSGVGLTADVSLIQELLIDEYDIEIVYTNWKAFAQYDIPQEPAEPVFANYDVGIFFQDYDIKWLDRNKINILIANEEWLQHHKLLVLKEFDKIITKSSFAKQLLSPYNNNIVNCGFITKDNLTIKELDYFIESNKETFELLAFEHIKKLNSLMH